jgi:hypothetical protein
LPWKNLLKQQLLIEYFDDDQWIDSKEGYHQKEKNIGSQSKIDNNQKGKKNYFHYTEVEK